MESMGVMLQRVLQQNAFQYAPKRTAFCTKTHCNMHQNALHFAPKREAKCSKIHPKSMKSSILGAIYGCFDHFG